jgi:tetratricopeptide (TPR) repeat protein
VLTVVVFGLPRWVARQQSAENSGASRPPVPTAAPTIESPPKAEIPSLDAEAGIRRTVDDAIEKGRKDLAGNDPEAAMIAFSRAAALDPGNAAAEDGLRRSQRAAQVRKLETEALAFARRGETRRATETARRVLELDPGSQTARRLLDQMADKTAEDAYQAQISQGLAALEEGSYDAAVKAFSTASEMRPGTPEVADGLARARAGIRRQTIAAHLEAGGKAETAEDWPRAIGEYTSALALEPGLAPAREGLERSRRRLQLTERISFHLAHPDRLATDEVLDEAEDLVDEARGVSPRGPALEALIAQLANLVATSSVPVPVVLRSDGLTEVTLFTVGRLGTFDRRTVNLRPGTYTVVGRRPGFRDVRLTIRVRPDDAPASVDIRCAERI